MNHLDQLEAEAKTGNLDAIYLYGMALWYVRGHYSDEVHEWFEKAAIEGDPESLYQSGIESFSDYGEPADEARQLLWSAAVRGHAKSCMALCSLEFEHENADWGMNWYRRGRDLGHPHDLAALSLFDNDNSKGTPYGAVPREDFELFLRQWAELVGHYPEDHISAYVWYSVGPNLSGNAVRLSTVLEQTEIDEAEKLVGECKKFYKSRPKKRRKIF